MKTRLVKALIDTNVLVSGLLGGPTGSSMVDHFRAHAFTLVISTVLLEELVDVLHRPKFEKSISGDEIVELVRLIQLKAEWVEPISEPVDCRDGKDNRVLAAAVEGGADVIVTGDDDLLLLHPYRRVEIVTPRSFLERLAAV